MQPWRATRWRAINERIGVKPYWLIGLVLAAWLGGCAKPDKQGLYTHYDNINGDVFDLIADNKLTVPNETGGELWLNGSRANMVKGTMLYHLEAHYVSNVGWLQVEPGETLSLTIDGKEVKYAGSGSANFRKSTSKGVFTEDFIYRVGPEDFRRIAAAKTVKVKIFGTKGSLYREFDEANIEKFRAFVKAKMTK
jgi:hypothetical protein